MDACGVCDGSGDSCKTNVVVETATAARRRQLLETSDSALQLKSAFARLLNYPEALVTVSVAPKPGDASTTVARITAPHPASPASQHAR